MQGPLWILAPVALTMLISSNSSKEKAYSLLIRHCSLILTRKHWFPSLLIPKRNLIEPLSRPWSRWAASSTVEEERSGSTVNSLDDWWSLSKCVYKCYISSFLTIPRWVKTWKCTYFSYLIVVINWHAYNCCIIVTLFMFHLMKKNIFYRFVIHKGCLNDQ